jgi:polyketide biosynthesis acyl carrier protein
MKNKAQILQLIADSAREVLPELQAHVFIASDRLADLGANSVDRAEIAMLVQEALNLSVPRVELFAPGDIGELADLLVKKLNVA